ncbi:methyl-accepting chemotaxis protein [Delftia sp. PS-11]|uniref:methyl-accepting chemotaxis protein n=1 Tax=Delftia sp. PS-11 TaxID=2767222 RepID=UPI002453DF7F|nr:methyl-accepting chemotaxis protein [Delftia sp. PS-11]KAJ8742634.1 MCP four helix bundle domain-containing protein [Delftia sp. PS-11]
MKLFNQLRTRTKLALAFGTILVLMLASGASSLMQASRINASTVDLADNWLPSINLLGDLKEQLNLVRRAEFRHMLEETAEQKQAMHKAVGDTRVKFERLLERYAPLVSSAEEKQLYEQIRRSWQTYIGLSPRLLELSGQEGRLQDAKALAFNDSFKAFNELTALLEKSIALNREGATRSAEAAEDDFLHARNLLLGFLLLSILISSGLGWLLTRAVTRPLGAEPQEINELVGRLADGDLRAVDLKADVSRRSVLAAVVRLQTQLAESLAEVRSASDSVAVATEQIAQGNANLASRTEEQASGLEETAASIEQVTAAVQGSADNARQADQLAGRVSAVATEGGQAVQNMVQTMARIQDSSRRIADITGLIDGIAFQTNILALNAAVEAARAGEQGRGFAVVAAEVRSLAVRSAEAAKEIKGLIEHSVQEVEAGCNLAARVGQTIDSVVTQVRQVSTLVSEISAASREQTEGIRQINEAIGRLDTNTQHNASLVEETSSAAYSLNQQAQLLTHAVAVFKLDQAGTATGPRLHAVPATVQETDRASGDWQEPARVLLRA